jgi:hypothetical protein
MERARRGKTSYAISLSLSPLTSAGWQPTCVFVTVNLARRYLAGREEKKFSGRNSNFSEFPCWLSDGVRNTPGISSVLNYF